MSDVSTERVDSRWYRHAAEGVDLTGDIDQIEQHVRLRDAVKGCRYHVHAPARGEWLAYASARTIRQAISNGHVDLEIWCYSNPMVSMVTKQRGRNGAWQYRSVWVAAPNVSHWTMDVDDSPCRTEAEMDALLESRACPVPTQTIRTGPGRFHLHYMGSDGFWTRSQRWLVAARAAGLASVPDSLDEFKAALKKNGIDFQYLLTEPGKTKYRVPGSVNWNHSRHPVTGRITTPFVVTGTINRNYSEQAVLAVLNQQAVVPTPVVQPRPTKSDDRWKRYLPRVRAAVASIVGDELVDGIAEMIASNATRLTRKDFRICQTRMASDLGISQPSASRLLRRLKRANVLTQEKNGVYSVGKRSKTYGAGSSLDGTLAFSTWKDEPYEDGKTNEQIKTDIRALCYKGWTDEQIVAFCMDKQAARARSKWRPRSYFVCTVRAWRRRKPLFPINTEAIG